MYLTGKAQEFTGWFRTVATASMALCPLYVRGLGQFMGAKGVLVIGMLGTPVAGIMFLVAEATQPVVAQLVVAAVQGALDGILTTAGKTYMASLHHYLL